MIKNSGRVVALTLFSFTASAYAHDVRQQKLFSVGDFYQPTGINDADDVVIEGVRLCRGVGALDITHSSVLIRDLQKAGPIGKTTLRLYVVNSVLVVEGSSVVYDDILIYAKNSKIVFHDIVSKKIFISIADGDDDDENCAQSTVSLANYEDQTVRVILEEFPLDSFLFLEGRGKFEIDAGKVTKPLHGKVYDKTYGSGVVFSPELVKFIGRICSGKASFDETADKRYLRILRSQLFFPLIKRLMRV